jgi:hypothetical protein
MLIKWDHEAVRLTGRWDRRNADAAVTTNTGGVIEASYYGQMAVLHFDMDGNAHPYPHLWIQVDGGPRVEATAEPYIRIQSFDSPEKQHYVKIIMKSALESRNRWYAPLVSKFSFKGMEADKPGVLREDSRKVIEFVGDSITEGILIDTDYGDETAEAFVYKDDVCATYAWLASEILDFRPRIMGYGAVGATKPGNGGVPKAAEAYPFVYDGCPLAETLPDYIVINHGANDMFSAADTYGAEYMELLKTVRRINPASRIFCLSAFYGVYPETLCELIRRFNGDYNDSVVFIDSAGWVPREPLHPTREGHRIIAGKLVEELGKYIG